MDDDFAAATPVKRERPDDDQQNGGHGPSGKKPRRGGAAGEGSSSMCFVSNCPEPKKTGKKWCATHNVAFDSMSYQARSATPPELDTLNQIMSSPEAATQAMNDWCRDNPVGDGLGVLA